MVCACYYCCAISMSLVVYGMYGTYCIAMSAFAFVLLSKYYDTDCKQIEFMRWYVIYSVIAMITSVIVVHDRRYGWQRLPEVEPLIGVRQRYTVSEKLAGMMIVVLTLLSFYLSGTMGDCSETEWGIYVWIQTLVWAANSFGCVVYYFILCQR